MPSQRVEEQGASAGEWEAAEVGNSDEENAQTVAAQQPRKKCRRAAAAPEAPAPPPHLAASALRCEPRRGDTLTRQPL